MPTPTTPSSLRAFVSLSVLAEEILTLSRARLYELIERGAMPHPCYDLRSRRPVFTREQQEQALAVRTSGVGIDGSAVIFYRRERTPSPAAVSITSVRARRRASSQQPNRFADLVSGLHALGVSQADEQSVSSAVAELFPSGIEGQQESDVLRTLFRHLRRRETA
jgi:hypothetical protein